MNEDLVEHITNEDLHFFLERNPDEEIFDIAIEKNNVLFARWCYLHGWSLDGIAPESCTPEFALFMLEIIPLTDPHFAYFMKKALEDEQITKNMKFVDDYQFFVAHNKPEAIVTYEFKENPFDGNALFGEKENANIVKLGLLLGYNFNIETLLDVMSKADDKALRNYLIHIQTTIDYRLNNCKRKYDETI